MSTSTATLPTARPALDQAIGFFRWLYDDQAGYIEIVAGVPFPDKPEKIKLLMPTRDDPRCVNTRRWCYYDPERPDLLDQAAAYVAELAARYGNVYIGCRLYTRAAKDANHRSEAETLPSRVIFVDDAPAAPELRYSASIRTSEGSRHAYYKGDRPVTKDDARRAAAALGGDPSGVDLTQLVRVPGTFNTKNGGRFPVHAEQTSGPIYRLDDLRAQWPDVKPETHGTIEPLDWPEVEAHLANIDALLNCGRSKRIKPDTQTGRILAGEMLALPSSRYARLDDSTSMNACAAGLGFYLRGYIDDEIAAVLFHLYEQWGTLARKGTAWVKADIQRILGYCHEKHPEARQSPTRYRKEREAQPITYILAPSRARKDRPRRLDPEMLFARYQANPALCELKRKARAAALSISTATLDRLEDALERQEKIAIEIDARRQGSRVILIGVINIAAPEVLSTRPIATSDEAPITRAESDQTDHHCPQCIGETHPPPEAPRPPAPAPAPEPPPPLPAAIRAAIVAIEQHAVDPATGEHWRGRANPDRVRAHITAHWPAIDTTEVEAVYPQVRKALTRDRAQQRAHAKWAAERGRVCGLQNDGLLVALGGWASKLAHAEAKRPGSPYAKHCAAMFALHDDERRRRGLATNAPRDRARRKAATARTIEIARIVHRPPARVDRAVPTQTAFVNLVEDVAWLPPLATGALPRAVCSPQPTAEPLPAPVVYYDGYVDDMIARFKARRCEEVS